MRTLPISGFPITEPEDAGPELRQLYDEAQRVTGLPVIPSWATIAAASPECLEIFLEMYQLFRQKISLPEALIPIILYCIATARNCTYCSNVNELYCRTLGVDEETLERLAHDLDNVTPERLRAIIQFALQCAFDSQSLTAADYDSVREQGIGDDELAQIIFLAALANFNDTLADGFKIEVEPAVLEALGR